MLVAEEEPEGALEEAEMLSQARLESKELSDLIIIARGVTAREFSRKGALAFCLSIIEAKV